LEEIGGGVKFDAERVRFIYGFEVGSMMH